MITRKKVSGKISSSFCTNARQNIILLYKQMHIVLKVRHATSSLHIIKGQYGNEWESVLF